MSRLKSLLYSFVRLPNYIQLEPTTKCNFACKPCMRSRETNLDMPLTFYQSIVDQFGHTNPGSRTINFTGLGEPLLNPNLIHMVKYAHDRGFRTGFTTNSALINPKLATELIQTKLDYLQVSFDAAAKQSFEKIRIGSCFEEIMENVSTLVKTRKDLNSTTPRLTFLSTLSKDNAEEIPQIIKLAEELGVDGVSFARAHGGHVEEAFSSASWKDLLGSKIQIKTVDQTNSLCLRGLYITYDGKVLPCGHYIEMVSRGEYYRFQFGDLTQHSLRSIWFSNRYKQFRTRIALTGNCHYCPVFCPVYDVSFGA